MKRELKARSAGETMGEILGVFVEHMGTIIGVVATVTVPVLIVASIVTRNLIDYEALANDQLVLEPGALRNTLIAALFAFAANALAAGAVVHAVAGAYIGRPSDVGGSISFAAAHLGVLIVALLLWSLGLIVGLFMFVVPGIVLAVGWVAWASVLLVEEETASGSLQRSWQLTRSRRWQVFGIGVALFVLAVIISSIVGSIADALGQEALSPPSINTTILNIIGDVVINAMFSTAAVVVYLELRTRKEGAEVVEADLRKRFEPDPGTDLFR